jgi:hypothetical protein
MSENLTPPLDEAAEPQRSKADEWGDIQELRELKEVLPKLTPLPWSMHMDPTKVGEQTYYISGPPDTSVVMDNLTYDNASMILRIVNSVSAAVEAFDRLAQTVELLETEPDPTSIHKLIQQYQLKIAQLSGEPTPIPEVSKAQDLSFMHIGQTLTLPGGETFQIYNVEQKPGVTVVHLEGTIAYLPPDYEIGVNIESSWTTPSVLEAPEQLPTDLDEVSNEGSTPDNSPGAPQEEVI